MSTQTQTQTAETWWDEDGPIPGPDLEQTGIVVRQPQGAQIQRRSEYAELAELAAAHGPRNPTTLLQEARRVGSLLGARAYYDFPAGGGRVTGPSIDLMDALAIVWGRLVQRVEVLEETQDRVHLRGRIVDLLALTATERDYVSAIAPAPGKFANKPDQVERWRVMQIQSASSKAVRGALEHALPAWLVDAALDAARGAASQQATGGRPLPEARLMAVEALGRLGLDRATLEAHVEQPLDLWTVDELAQLRKLRDQLRAGEVAVEAVVAAAALKAASQQPQQGQGDKLGSLGLRKPSSTPSPSSEPERPAPASGVDQRSETRPARDHGANAAALRGKIRARLDKGEPVWHHDVKAALKGVMGTSRIALDTIQATVAYGAERGWWTVSIQRNDAGEVTGYGLNPVAEEQDEPAPARTSTPWDKLVGTALDAAFTAVVERVDIERAEQAYAAAGVTDPEAELTDDQRRQIGRALEAL